MRRLGPASMRAHLGWGVALVAALAPSSGCFTSRYLSQAACGELEILAAARPIREVVADERTPVRTRRLLLAVGAIERFGETQGLRPTENYRRYSDLHRSAAVWVVGACPPLALDPKHWDFCVVGSVPYLGFFHEDEARRYGAELEKEGLDVEVREADAYSTLGWFNDPVLSTMIPDGPEALGELANAVLHESLHATIYVDDQSVFDESLASFVADRLTPPWLESAVGPDAPETRAWSASDSRWRTVLRRLHETWVELDELYRSSRSDAEKLAEKARILEAVRAELRLRRPLNNAVLAGYKTYDTGAPAFERLLAACGGSWPRFLATLAKLHPSSFARPQQEDLAPVVDALVERGCAAAPTRS